MCIDHRRFDIFVTQKFLDRSDRVFAYKELIAKVLNPKYGAYDRQCAPCAISEPSTSVLKIAVSFRLMSSVAMGLPPSEVKSGRNGFRINDV